MWLHNVLRLGRFRRRLGLCRRALNERRPDLVVPVDFGGFNLYLCRAAAARGVPTFYYIPPQVWAHGRYRAKKLRKWTDRVGYIYPFERGLYRDYGVEAEYVGHPLFDELARRPPSAQVVEGLRKRFGPNLIAVFPGSRRQEVRATMPVIGEACRRLARRVPEAAFAVLAGPKVREAAAELLSGGPTGMELVDDVRPVELARAARLCLTKSGTITLEIASQGTPMVIFYRASPLVGFLGYGLSHVPYFGLINLLAGRIICPERAMTAPEPRWLAEAALRLLEDADAYDGCRRAVARALEGFAQPGASERAALSALSLVG
jgi:lipid-A-disaccharide synthase